MQEAITGICVEQDLRCYISWLGHNEFRPKAECRIVLGSESDGWLLISVLLSCPEILIGYLILYKLTCPGANFTGKAPKLKFYSSGVTGKRLILHTPTCLVMSFLY